MFEYTQKQGLSCDNLEVYCPRSESFSRHNLFYAFNLGGLVTYILCAHLIRASLLWMDTAHFTSCLLV